MSQEIKWQVSSAAVVRSQTQVRTRTFTDGTRVQSEVRVQAGTRPDVQSGVQLVGKDEEPVQTGPNLPEPENKSR